MATVMVVDDEPVTRETVRTVLESEGYRIVEASNADDCWKKIQSSPPDLILLDIRMPGTPAVDLIKKIKESSKLRHIKIVYLTAIAGTKEVAKRLEGVVGTIEKPFKSKELVAMVKKALSHIVI